MLRINYIRRLSPPTFYIPLILIANWLRKLLNPFNIFSLLGRRTSHEEVYYNNTTVSKL